MYEAVKLNQNYLNKLADSLGSTTPLLGGGTPTKGKVPLQFKDNYHIFGTTGVGPIPQGFKLTKDSSCQERHMLVTVVQKQNTTSNSSVLLEVGSYQFTPQNF